MPYSTATLSLVETGGIGNTQRSVWAMENTDAVTTVRVAGYISNARARGMKVGDIVDYTKTDASPITIQRMIVVSINATTGAADLSDGTAITATNTD